FRSTPGQRGEVVHSASSSSASFAIRSSLLRSIISLTPSRSVLRLSMAPVERTAPPHAAEGRWRERPKPCSRLDDGYANPERCLQRSRNRFAGHPERQFK